MERRAGRPIYQTSIDTEDRTRPDRMDEQAQDGKE
jgi:hypothetical protein